MDPTTTRPPRSGLTDRQQRESAYYERYASMHAVDRVDFTPVLSSQRRPWSPCWHVCGLGWDPYRGPDQRLLDADYGMGVAAVTFVRLGYQVEGFDLSDADIGVARRLADRRVLSDRVSLRAMPAEQLDYPDEHFDLVVGIDILHHVDIPLVIRHVRRVFKTGGVTIFKEPLRAPVIDALRESRVVTALAPRATSLDREVHIAEDERKLSVE